MKGRDRFTKAEAVEIKRLLQRVREAEPGTPQKMLRAELRGIGFYISDWAGGPEGFMPSDFDDLIRRKAIAITDGTMFVGSERVPASSSKPPRRSRRRAPAATVAGAARDEAIPALAALAGLRLSIKEAVDGGVPDRPGLYAIYGSARVWRTLELGEQLDDRPLYVGKAEDSLVSRDLNTHFATGTTGRSSPRRSFAALLSAASTLELVAMPRRPHDPEPGKWTHYALEAPGDGDLTDWMRSKLQIAVWAAPAGTGLGPVESTVMRHWLPPLNLTGVSTQWTAQVKNARAMMAEHAKGWARARGFDV